MESFTINGVGNSYIHFSPNTKAKYGIAFSYWRTNLQDLIFACELIRKSWFNEDLIEISIGSFALPSPEEIERLKKVVNYIVKVDEDLLHQLGTTSGCNAALYPLMNNENLEWIGHSDADCPWINCHYFFSFCTLLKDTGKFLLGTQDTYLYDLENLTTSIYEGHDILQTAQLGSMWVFNRKRALDSGYFPLSMGPDQHFEKDRYTHFIGCGFTIEDDAIIVKRAPIDIDLPPNFLYSFDVNAGILHQTNCLEFPEVIDRKQRLLQLMYTPAWENMTLGFRQHYNPKSPRQIKG
jgi:hypothetical protein